MVELKEAMTFQWALPDSLDVPRDRLSARIDVYSEAILLHLISEHTITTRLVSALDIAQAFTREMAITSGLLPERALWWSTDRNGALVALWRSPKVWQVALQLEAFKPSRRFCLPMPGLIFLCQPGAPPWVFAAKKRPTTEHDKLYHAPLFNVFRNGRSCKGTHKYGPDPSAIPEEFFEAFFSPAGDSKGRSKRYPDNILKLWESIDNKRRYPLRDLVQIGPICQVVKELNR